MSFGPESLKTSLKDSKIGHVSFPSVVKHRIRSTALSPRVCEKGHIMLFIHPDLSTPGPSINTPIWPCRKVSKWEHSFHWKLPYNWLKDLWPRQIAVVIQAPGYKLYSGEVGNPLVSFLLVGSCSHKNTPLCIELTTLFKFDAGRIAASRRGKSHPSALYDRRLINEWDAVSAMIVAQHDRIAQLKKWSDRE